MVLSDINMPNMDGIEFVQLARANNCQIPIVMITTEGGGAVLRLAIDSARRQAIR